MTDQAGWIKSRSLGDRLDQQDIKTDAVAAQNTERQQSIQATVADLSARGRFACVGWSRPLDCAYPDAVGRRIVRHRYDLRKVICPYQLSERNL